MPVTAMANVSTPMQRFRALSSPQETAIVTMAGSGRQVRSARPRAAEAQTAKFAAAEVRALHLASRGNANAPRAIRARRAKSNVRVAPKVPVRAMDGARTMALAPVKLRGKLQTAALAARVESASRAQSHASRTANAQTRAFATATPDGAGLRAIFCARQFMAFRAPVTVSATTPELACAITGSMAPHAASSAKVVRRTPAMATEIAGQMAPASVNVDG